MLLLRLRYWVGMLGTELVQVLLHVRLRPCLHPVLADDRIGLHGQGFTDGEAIKLHDFVVIVMLDFVSLAEKTLAWGTVVCTTPGADGIRG